MTYNLLSLTFDLASTDKAINRASWALHYLSGALCNELRDVPPLASLDEWCANRCARQCWEEMRLVRGGGRYVDTAACVGAVIAGGSEVAPRGRLQ